jgi:hypothetical protein
MDDKELMAKVEERRKLQFIHDKFQKHTPLLSKDGNEVAHSWRSVVCSGCGMPVARAGNKLGSVTPISLEGYLEDKDRFGDRVSYIAAVQAYLEMSKDPPKSDPQEAIRFSIRDNAFNGLKVDQVLKDNIHLLDQAQIEKIIFGIEEPSVEKIAKYTAHISGAANDYVLDALRKTMPKKGERMNRWRREGFPDHIASMAHMLDIKLPKDLNTYVINKSQDLLIRQYMATSNGKPVLSVINASDNRNANLSYAYLKKYFPEKFMDAGYMHKKLLMDRWEPLALQYYVETGLGLDNLTHYCDTLAICKLAYGMYPEQSEDIAAKIAELKAREDDEVRFLFGDRENQREAASTVDNLAVLAGLCDNIHQYMDKRVWKQPTWQTVPDTADEAMREMIKLEQAPDKEKDND